MGWPRAQFRPRPRRAAEQCRALHVPPPAKSFVRQPNNSGRQFARIRASEVCYEVPQVVHFMTARSHASSARLNGAFQPVEEAG